MEPLETVSYADSLAHQAYRVLEQAIVTLALAPGSLVTEKQLIDLAGQGRTPVREAILKLEWQGLIVVKPRSGLLIADIAPSDWQNVMAMRRRLEPEAAALVARHADDGQRRRLVECARDMSTAAVMADTVGFLAADKRFDDIMEHACPNRFLSAALAPLRAHARRLWCATATTELMDRAVGLHLAVIRAIQTGDCVEAAAATGRLLDALPDLER
ncbi:GntR family transcriptional regulator [Rhizobium straminoryzae]|uniref:GntR family transcriptional regulator n=1 Tax=Rhizobium straminoryzae TaxID=1387186 RepID=A0A549TGE9_9HYPH|nr:GntR family transcriptional regulator [Rhizobium straminoryzae]TRL41855.1 GntR family transcriptional regulator [Rhizobium straminoryzae]